MAENLIDDDDDVPEEVTLNEGREKAEEARREEKESQRRIAADLKDKRRSRLEKKAKEGVPYADQGTDPKPGYDEVADLPEPSRRRKRNGRDLGSSNSEGPDLGPVMLDEGVVELLRAREKQAAKGVGQAKHKYIEEEERQEPAIKKTSKSDDNSTANSRTQIVSLKSKPNSAVASNALDFRRSHFFGQRVKRSATMLPSTSKPFQASV